MKRLVILTCAAAFVLMAATAAFAIGPHDMDCMDCHSTHYAKGDYAIGVTPKAMDNPARTRNNMNADSIDQLCLGCHNDEEGIMPVDLASTHPTGVKITYAKVPAQLLKDGKFSCVSCHNPHPSNASYKYLVVDTGEGANMGTFCAKCHAYQSDPDAVTAAATAPIMADPPGAPIIRVNSK